MCVSFKLTLATLWNIRFIHQWVRRYKRLSFFSVDWNTNFVRALPLPKYELFRPLCSLNSDSFVKNKQYIISISLHDSNLVPRWKYIPNQLLFKSNSRVIFSTRTNLKQYSNIINPSGCYFLPASKFQHGLTSHYTESHLVFSKINQQKSDFSC